jgi:hypothetical protein
MTTGSTPGSFTGEIRNALLATYQGGVDLLAHRAIAIAEKIDI